MNGLALAWVMVFAAGIVVGGFVIGCVAWGVEETVNRILRRRPPPPKPPWLGCTRQRGDYYCAKPPGHTGVCRVVKV